MSNAWIFFHTKLFANILLSQTDCNRIISQGRGGKGNLYVFGNGDDYALGNGTCGYDEYVSSIYTISISVMTGKNEMSRDNVECTGVSAVTYGRRESLDNHDLMVSIIYTPKSLMTHTSHSLSYILLGLYDIYFTAFIIWVSYIFMSLYDT